MASRLLRRSGVAVGLVAELLGWRADAVYQVGIGSEYQEVAVLMSEWPGVKFFGCEPCPSLADKLRTEYPGKLFDVALSDANGELPFYTRKRHVDGSSLYEQENSTTAIVHVRTMDWLWWSNKPRYQHVLLWLDCEGNELKALQGGCQFLKSVEMVNVEMTANPVNSDWCTPLSVHSYLKECGFLRQWIHTQRTSSGQYDAIYVRPHLFKPKYCCDPIQL